MSKEDIHLHLGEFNGKPALFDNDGRRVHGAYDIKSNDDKPGEIWRVDLSIELSVPGTSLLDMTPASKQDGGDDE